MIRSGTPGTPASANNNGGWKAVRFQPGYQYGLWPDEPAWKVRFEFSRLSGFSESEQWTVQNIPIQRGTRQELWNYGRRRQTQADAPSAEAGLNGIHVKIFPAKQFTDVGPNQNPQGGLFIQTEPQLPQGMRLTVVALTDNQTTDIQHWNYGSLAINNTTAYRCGLSGIGGLTNLNLTLALHKSRFVEFMVNPEIAPATAATVP